MKKFMGKKGISMIVVVITIVVIIILSTIVLRNSFSLVTKTELSEFANEVLTVETKAVTMQLQLQKDKKNDISFEVLGFDKVKLNRVPWNFKSVDDDMATGYVVNLDVLGLDSVARGRGTYIPGGEVTFGEADLFIIDKFGKVYYGIGVEDDDGKKYYNLETQQSKGVIGPTISDITYTLIDNGESAEIRFKATPELGGKVSTYVGNIKGDNLGDNWYKVIVNNNGTHYIRAVEIDGLMSVSNVYVEGIDE
jgi:type II secretory pathway pseudopilin PulG